MSDLNTDYRAFVAKLFNRNGDLSKDFAHAIMGVVTEAYELSKAPDEVNELEEKGDLRFFAEAAHMVVEEATADMTPGEAKEFNDAARQARAAALQLDPKETLLPYCIDLLDAAKRWVGYGKEPKEFAVVLVKVDVILSIALSHAKFHHTDDRIIKANMAKLLKRYPGGEFDAYRAVTRDVEAERAVLEKH